MHSSRNISRCSDEDKTSQILTVVFDKALSETGRVIDSRKEKEFHLNVLNSQRLSGRHGAVADQEDGRTSFLLSTAL